MTNLELMKVIRLLVIFLLISNFITISVLIFVTKQNIDLKKEILNREICVQECI